MSESLLLNPPDRKKASDHSQTEDEMVIQARTPEEIQAAISANLKRVRFKEATDLRKMGAKVRAYKAADRLSDLPHELMSEAESKLYDEYLKKEQQNKLNALERKPIHDISERISTHQFEDEESDAHLRIGDQTFKKSKGKWVKKETSVPTAKARLRRREGVKNLDTSGEAYAGTEDPTSILSPERVAELKKKRADKPSVFGWLKSRLGL